MISFIRTRSRPGTSDSRNGAIPVFPTGESRWIMSALRILLFLIPAAICTGVVVVARWVCFPLSRRVSGLHFSVLSYSPDQPGNPLLSYGVLAAICILVAAWAVLRNHPKALGWVSSCLLILSVAAWLQVSLGNSSLLTDLVDENSQKHLEYEFTNKYVPVNAGVDPTFLGSPSTITLSNRLETGWYFLGFGWYLATALGLGLYLYSIYGSRRARWQVLPFTGLAVAALTVGFSLRPFFWYFLGFGWCLATAVGLGLFLHAIYRWRRARWQAFHFLGLAVAALSIGFSFRPFLGHLAFLRAQSAEAAGNLHSAAQ